MDKTLLKLAIKLIDLGWTIKFDTNSRLLISIADVDYIGLCIWEVKKKSCKYKIYNCWNCKTYQVSAIKDLEKTINEAFNIAYKNVIKKDLDYLISHEISHIIEVQKQKNKPFTTVLSVEEEALLLAFQACPIEFTKYSPMLNYSLKEFKQIYDWAKEQHAYELSPWTALYAMYDYYMLKLTEESFNNFVNSYLNEN